jgi:D-arabinose 5-phosphate isomerase GutQ
VETGIVTHVSEPTDDVERLLSLARELVHAESAGIAALAARIDERLVDVARRLVSSEGKVLVCGLGTSGETARRMAHILSVTGTPSLFIHPADALHGGLGAVEPRDVVIAISWGGQSEEVNEFVQRSRGIGAFVVAITGDATTDLVEASSVAITLDANVDAEPGGIAAMGSTLVVAAWGDALALVAMELRHHDWAEVLYRHPRGAVGSRGREHPGKDA